MEPGRERRAGFAVGYALWAVMVGTTVPNALWGWYQEELEISTAVVSAAFATYAAAVVASLVGWGSLADRRGPWRSLFLATALAAAASAVSLMDGLPALFAGRTLAGLSVGLVSGAAVAALAEVHRRGAGGAARVSTFATMAGLAAGPLLAAAVVEAVPDSPRVAYLVHLAAVAPVLVWLCLRQQGSGANTAPRRSLAVPAGRAFRAAAVMGFAANAQLGLYAVLAPAMLIEVLDNDSVLLSGLAGCLLFSAAGTAQLTTARLSTSPRLAVAVAALLMGVVAVVAALGTGSLGLLLLAIALGGLGGGMAFGEGLDVATRSAPPHQRAAVSSTWFVVAYLGLVGPVLGAGALAESVGVARAAALVSAVTTVLVVASTLVVVRHAAASPSPIPEKKEKLWTSS